MPPEAANKTTPGGTTAAQNKSCATQRHPQDSPANTRQNQVIHNPKLARGGTTPIYNNFLQKHP